MGDLGALLAFHPAFLLTNIGKGGFEPYTEAGLIQPVTCLAISSKNDFLPLPTLI